MIVGSFGTLFIKVKVMTENTPKKPRRKRRTKAEIEAEKAAKAPKEVKTDDVVVEMLEETVTSVDPVKEDTAAIARKRASRKPLDAYIPQTGINKFRNKLAQRKLRNETYEANRKKK